MTQEEKAKKYEDALANARQEYNTTENVERKQWLEELFPELKESEDERIRKWIIGVLATYEHDKNLRDAALAWLEKQQKTTEHKVEPKFKVGDKDNWELVHEFVEKFGRIPKDEDELNVLVEYILKQKSKLKVGDWVVYDHRTYKVVELPKEGYINLGLRRNGKITFAPFTYCRLWTIQDAKEGDALVCKGNIKNSNGVKYERICLFNNLDNAFFTLTKTSNYTEEYDIDVNIDYPANTVPATKEQKEILFMAIKEAGYEWNAEKNELMKNNIYTQ